MEKYYIATISAAKYVGIATIRKLLDCFGDAKSVWTAKIDELFEVGMDKRAFDSFVEFRTKNPNAPEKLIEYCTRNNINLCSIVDDDYPPILKEIQSPPAVFYYYGKLEPFADRVAMVGTRHNTNYGKTVALEISETLARAGITIVSGAALGIDTFSHIGAMKSGRTVAVLGCGINFAFRTSNKNLIKQIAENGVVMTDYPPSQNPSAETFPPRNRIIAGLSRGVIIVEAGLKSGALITSTYAGDYGRDVFAVPGSIFEPKSVGCHKLIRDGAVLITCAEDVLEFYNVTLEKILRHDDSTCDKKSEIKIVKNESIQLEGIEKKIFDVIPSGNFISVDEILMEVDEVSIVELSRILLQLEMKNCIVEEDGNYSKMRN